MGTTLKRPLLLLLLAGLFCLLGASLAARVATAAGPVETSIFAVQGVDVDVTDKDAATAKDKALWTCR